MKTIKDEEKGSELDACVWCGVSLEYKGKCCRECRERFKEEDKQNNRYIRGSW